MKKNGFSKRIRELRRQKNLSQKELGKIVGLHYTHISRYERGLSIPASDTLKRLAEGLGVTADYLIEGQSIEVARAKIEDKDFLQMFKEAERLPEDDKMVIKKLINAFLTNKKIQALARV